MANVKKAYAEIVAYLQENADKKVKAVLPTVIEMSAAKSAGGTASAFHKNDDGVVTHIRCGYFGQWMPLSHVEFGSKQGSASGYNSMCKEGVNNYTRQNREYKQAKEALLTEVAEGKVSPDQIGAELERLEAKRKETIPHSAGIGFETLDEALAADPAELDRLVAEAQPEPEAETESAE